MGYKEIMCCNCKTCRGEEIIKYHEQGAEVTRCVNFIPNYEYKSVGVSCAFFDMGAEDEDN